MAPPLTKAQQAQQAKLAAQQEMASRVLARRRLLPFIERMNPKYMAGWVHQDICRRLERFSDAVAAGTSPRLMLLMPPRHGKSEIASKNFPAWHLGRHPDHEIIACSYNISLAMGFSKKIKALFDDPSFQTVFDARLDPNNQSTEEWGLHGTGGGYVAAGVGGGITGKGAHVLTIDDPIKNAEEADSANTRESLWDWYGSTAYTRLAPGAGVLVIQCMTGDTPVLMADGGERRLDTLAVGDKVATYACGKLAVSSVKGFKSNGHDLVYKITMSSGKIVRANGRHPFLTAIDGELKWVRTRSLTTAQKIVTLKGSGGSGKGSSAPLKDAQSLLSAEHSALRITTSKNGLTEQDHLASTLSLDATPTSNIATVSPSLTTTDSLKNRAVCAPSARPHQTAVNQATGETSSPSITVTKPAKYEDCCAITATQGSDILEPSPWHSPGHGISDFTLEEVVSVEPDGVEEVFDVQINHTENFIANGLVSHNTWWHDDDLAGRLQQAMQNDPDSDQFEIIKYPALADEAEFLDPGSDEIIRIPVQHAPDAESILKFAEAVTAAQAAGYDPAKLTYLRGKGDPLHEARYDRKKLLRIKATIAQRFWSALYQQNPVPDDGAFFTKDQFKRGALPRLKESVVQIAWDFAISEKQHNDYTVGTVGLLDYDDTLHIAEVIRFKKGDAFFIVDSILNLAQRWYHPSLILGFEDGQIFRSIEALLKKGMRERHFYPRIEVLKPITDKKARASALQGRMQQGMVSFNSTAEWYDTARQEMLRFPAGVHDDIVDSMAWMAQLAVGREPPQKPKIAAQKSWKDKLRIGGGSAGHMSA